MTIGLDHGLLDSLITPNFSICWISFSIAHRWASGTRYGRCLTMVPDSTRVGENTSENWPTRCYSSAFWAVDSWGLTSTTTGRVRAADPVSDGTDLLQDGIRTLPAGQEFVGWVGDKDHHAHAEPWWGAPGLMAWPGRFVLSSLSHVRSWSGVAWAVFSTLLLLHPAAPNSSSKGVKPVEAWGTSRIPNSTYDSMRS